MGEGIEIRPGAAITAFVDEYVKRISRVIDEQSLAKVEQQLADYGYVKVVRCRDCKHATISSLGYAKYCEMFVLPDEDGYGADPQVNLPLDFFCAYGKRKEGDDIKGNVIRKVM